MVVLDLFTWYVKHKRLHSPTHDHYKNKKVESRGSQLHLVLWIYGSVPVIGH